MWNFPLFPEQASTIARDVDVLYFALIGLASFFGFGVAIVLIYFAIRYRHGAMVDRSNPVSSHVRLELVWIGVPLLLALGVFVWASALYTRIMTPPPTGNMEIYVSARQWMWRFQHVSGAREINELHVPVGRPVKLIMTSQDVIHSFYVPAFRVKQDVLPSRYVHAWFEATKPGTYHLFCAEYCGTEHAQMRGSVVVMEPERYEAWLRLGALAESEVATPSPPLVDVERPMADAGRALFENLRCDDCHRIDPDSLYPAQGPPLNGLFGRIVRLQNEREIVADEQYLRESILAPQAKLVQGYPPIMPGYAGQITDDELAHLIEYLKSL